MIWFIIKIIIDVIGNIIVFASIAFLIGKAAWQWQMSPSFFNNNQRKKRKLIKWRKNCEEILLLIWVKVSFLKIIYLAVALSIGLALILLFIPLYSQIGSIKCNILETCDSPKLNETQIRNLAFAFLGTVSGIAALFGGYLAILRANTNERQTYTEEQGLITDRINKAIERLSTNDKEGKPIIEVRLGAIYALERISQDSIRDHIQIMEILCAYIKTNSPRTTVTDTITVISKDIQTALNIIGWRGNGHEGKKRLKKEKKQNYRIDLSDCDLNGAKIYNANLHGAELHNTNIIKAEIGRTDLGWANLDHSDLRYTRFDRVDLNTARIRGTDADLSGATFTNGTNLKSTWFASTNLNKAIISGLDMSGAKLAGVNLTDVEIKNTNLQNTYLKDTDIGNADTEMSYAYEGDFSECKNLTQEQLNLMYCGIRVKIPKMDGNKKLSRPDHWPKEKSSEDEFKKTYFEWRKAEIAKLPNIRFSRLNPNIMIITSKE